MSLQNYTIKEILIELQQRGCLTSAASNRDILSKLNNNESCGVILTYGIPKKPGECSRCRCMFSAKEFSHYQARVSRDGCLQRSSAVCQKCAKIHKKELNAACKNSVIPPKPKPGDECPRCERSWSTNSRK